MRKKSFYLILLTLLFAVQSWAEKVSVSITMNATSRTMTLEPLGGGENVEIGTPVSYKYTFDAEPGKYTLTGYNSNGVNNGSIVIDIAEGTELTIYTCTAKATNKEWTINTDYTVESEVYAKDMTKSDIVLGADAQPQKAVTFLVPAGYTYNTTLVPSETHKAEGYMAYNSSSPVTRNTNISSAIPMGYEMTFTAPKDAQVFVGTKSVHFVAFKEVAPKKTEESGDNKIYTYDLAGKGVYNYRVSQSGKLTNADKFTMTEGAMSMEVKAEDLNGDSKQIDKDVASNNKYNVADIFMNVDAAGCVNLNKGETFQLEYFRTWQIIDNITNNYFIEPDYHFEVVDEQGQPSTDVIEISGEGVITAKKDGVAFVLVTYDAIRTPNQLGGPLYGAIWPENTGLAVVRVGATDAGIATNMVINNDKNTVGSNKQAGDNIDAELDVLYFVDGGASYNFKPEGATKVEIAYPNIGKNSASYTGFTTNGVTKNANGSYTILVKEGRNIVKLSSASGAVYQVVRGKKCEVTITNTTNPGQVLKPGDNATILLSGLYHPAHKMAGVYNMAAAMTYRDENDVEYLCIQKSGSGAFASIGSQYNFSSTDKARTVSVTIPTDWDETKDYSLKNGSIYCKGYGDPYGGHRDITRTSGKNPNFTATQNIAYFGMLPDVCLYKGIVPTYELRVLTFEDEDYKGDGNVLGNKDWSSLIDNAEYYGDLLYGEDASIYCVMDDKNTELYSELNAAYGSKAFWSGGCAVSNYYMTSFDGAGYVQQLSAYSPQGTYAGNKGSKNFAVCYGYDDGSTSALDSRPVFTFMDGKKHVIDHLYVNNSCYALNVIANGNDLSSKLGKNDYFRVVFQNYDGDDLVKEVSQDLVVNGVAITEWTKVDLSALGEVETLKINIVSSVENNAGMSLPAYVLLDDIAVRFEKDETPTRICPVVAKPDNQRTGEVYNIYGQRVPAHYRGIVIKAGKKYIQK